MVLIFLNQKKLWYKKKKKFKKLKKLITMKVNHAIFIFANNHNKNIIKLTINIVIIITVLMIIMITLGYYRTFICLLLPELSAWLATLTLPLFLSFTTSIPAFSIISSFTTFLSITVFFTYFFSTFSTSFLLTFFPSF